MGGGHRTVLVKPSARSQSRETEAGNHLRQTVNRPYDSLLYVTLAIALNVCSGFGTCKLICLNLPSFPHNFDLVPTIHVKHIRIHI